MKNSNEVAGNTTPCSLCHFCVKAEKESHGSVCVWYGIYIKQDEIHQVTPLREHCWASPDGDNFTWKLEGVSPLDYAAWRQDISQVMPSNIGTNIAIGISIISLIATLVMSLL